MAKTNSHEIWPGSMWLPEPGLSLEEQCRQELEMMAFINNTPVSYTHLDVYKRQCLNWLPLTVLSLNFSATSGFASIC